MEIPHERASKKRKLTSCLDLVEDQDLSSRTSDIMESIDERSLDSDSLESEPLDATETPLLSTESATPTDHEGNRVVDPLRRHWRPPFVEVPESEHDVAGSEAEQERPDTAQSRSVTPVPWTTLNPDWQFRIRKRQRAEERERKKDCMCPISLDCEHKPEDRKDCRIYAPHYGKWSAKGNTQRWQITNRQRPDNYRSLLGDARYLSRLVEELTTAEPTKHEEIFERFRNFLQGFYENDMDEDVLQESNVLDVIQNLKDAVAAGSLNIPVDIRDDLTYLQRKWQAGDLSVDEYRGLIRQTRDRRSRYSMDPHYTPRPDPDFFGAGHLVNGQHWPLRLCMVRDGAHKHHIAGICGRDKVGAQAVVLGKPEVEEYADVDMGDVIWYVGTAAKEGAEAEVDLEDDEDSDDEIPKGVTKFSKYLFWSKKTQKKVRVFRSFRLPAVNKQKPEFGYRFDGCYKVVDFELLETERALYRFKMIRCPGQAPIRTDIYANAI